METTIVHARQSDRSAPELLAPAGDRECLRAAVANGADAVYFGLQEFNARRRAENFTLEELPEIIDFLHGHNVRGYVAFNTLVFPEELERASDCLAAIAQAGVDAVIVQDLGVLRLARQVAPTLPIHASTQMTMTHADGIAFLAAMGVSRVILARELSMAKIAEIAAGTTVELEVFVHGALCISYSGQCLASESQCGRSANRGRCAQLCRLPYRLLVDGACVDEPDAAHLLSPRDLAAWPHVPQLLAAGVTGFKIEGRLKDAVYVAAATQIYRRAIDAAVKGEPFSLSPEHHEELAIGFSRGFTDGFLRGRHFRDLVDGRSPKSRSMVLGTVVGKTHRSVVVELCAVEAADGTSNQAVKPGDGLVFSGGQNARDEQGGRVYSVEPVGQRRVDRGTHSDGPKPIVPGERVELSFGRDDVDLSAVSIGSTVYKTDDPAVRKRIASTFNRDRVVRRREVFARVEATSGRPLVVSFRDGAGYEVHVASAEPITEAQRHPLTIEMLHEQLGRLGDTPFELAGVELIGEHGSVDSMPVWVSRSVLNDLRRQAVDEFTVILRDAAVHAVTAGDALAVLQQEVAGQRVPGREWCAVRQGGEAGSTSVRHHPQVGVLVRTLDQVRAVLEWRTSRDGDALVMLYGDFVQVADATSALKLAAAVGIETVLVTPVIVEPGEEAMLDRLAEVGPSTILVRNLASMVYLQRHWPAVSLIGDYSLNVANELTAGTLARAGLLRLTASYDLNIGQLRTMLARLPGVPVEVIVHSHVPMFHMAFCVAGRWLARADDCSRCSRPCRDHDLRLLDPQGRSHPLMTAAGGRTAVFSGAVQSILVATDDDDDDVLRDVISHVRVEFLDEQPEQVHAVLDTLMAFLNRKVSSSDALRLLGEVYLAGVGAGTFGFE